MLDYSSRPNIMKKILREGVVELGLDRKLCEDGSRGTQRERWEDAMLHC